jgi:CRP-like cAMP-binding protein
MAFVHPNPVPDHPLLARLAARYPESVVRLQYLDGEVILQEGDLDASLFFLEDGALVVEQTIGPGIPPRVLKLLTNSSDAGQIMPFGEMAQALGKRTASIRSSGGSTVVRLAVEIFEDIYREFPEIARTLNLKLVERLRDMNNRLKELSNRLEPPVERLFLERDEPLTTAGEPSDTLWQCVAGHVRRIHSDGASDEILPDADGFLDARTYFCNEPWPRTLEASAGAFLVRWKVTDRCEVFRFYPELALRLLKDST